MRLRDIINESEKSYEQQVEAIADLIIANCSEYLSQIDLTKDNHRLCRGTGTSVGKNGYSIESPRVDRRPKNTSFAFQEEFDKAIASKGGQALRSNSFFCTSDYNIANGYGFYTTVVYPTNGFSYTWVDGVRDLYIRVGDSIGYPPVMRRAANDINEITSDLEAGDSYWITSLLDINDKFITAKDKDTMKKLHDAFKVAIEHKSYFEYDIAAKMIMNVARRMFANMAEDLDIICDANIRTPLEKTYEILIRGKCILVRSEIASDVRDEIMRKLKA